MTGIEIVILVAGILCICISFLMAGKREEVNGQSMSSEPAEMVRQRRGNDQKPRRQPVGRKTV
mgnify:CR=1 FL=1